MNSKEGFTLVELTVSITLTGLFVSSLVVGYGYLSSQKEDIRRYTAASPINNGQVIQLSSSSFHTCAITLTGDIYCWGQGGSGRIGLPSDGIGSTHVLQRVNSSTPFSGQEFDQISTGGFHSCSVSQALIYC